MPEVLTRKDMPEVLTRKDIRNLTTEERDNLVRAFDAIYKLDATDKNSFFTIAGYHGEPFRGAGYGNPQWWGGYCNHGNILFPTWHRAYLYRLEQALQSQVPGVTIPYWNEIDDETTQREGIPGIFLMKQYVFADGTSIDNPLHSYTFQKSIYDRLSPIPDADYSKPIGYQTVRYPFSGLVGNADNAATQVHNNFMNELGDKTTNQLLNDNVKAWLNFSSYTNVEGEPAPAGVKDRYNKCLDAPNYLVFSNTTSAGRWNDDHSDEADYIPIVPLESPHNAIHLAVGGIQVPGYDRTNISGANGDMGENDTASFDPIFYFHHCFIDLMFWKWQVAHEETASLNIPDGYAHYPGTNSVDAQGPTPGVAGGTWLTLDSPLDPFGMTSKDVVNINNLGYKYDLPPYVSRPEAPTPSPVLSIRGINRGAISGSFAISAWAFTSNLLPPRLIGTEPVLSRWLATGCANCQNHLDATAHIPLEGWSDEDATNTAFEARVHTRANPGGLTALKGQKFSLGVGLRNRG